MFLSKELVSLSNKEAIDQIVNESLDHEQANCPVTHHFYPNTYVREVSVKAGTLLIGRYHKYGHLNVVTRGKCTLATDSGPVKVEAPVTFFAPPGNKTILVEEDITWLNIYQLSMTSVDDIEAFIFDDTLHSEKSQHAHATYKDSENTEKQLEYVGLPVGLNTSDEDVLPFFYGQYKYKISKSRIHEMGVLATGEIKEGEIVGITHVGDKRTPLIRYINHSDNPNCTLITVGDHQFVVATEDIGGCKACFDGEELTINYREHFKGIEGG